MGCMAALATGKCCWAGEKPCKGVSASCPAQPSPGRALHGVGRTQEAPLQAWAGEAAAPNGSLQGRGKKAAEQNCGVPGWACLEFPPWSAGGRPLQLRLLPVEAGEALAEGWHKNRADPWNGTDECSLLAAPRPCCAKVCLWGKGLLYAGKPQSIPGRDPCR